jgi:FixJ family two-component response regulator
MQEHAINLPIIFMTAHGDVSSSCSRDEIRSRRFSGKTNRSRHVAGSACACARKRLEDAKRAKARRTNCVRASHCSRRASGTFSIALLRAKSNKVVGDELGIAERTVKVHRAQLMAKLGVSSSAELGALG